MSWISCVGHLNRLRVNYKNRNRIGRSYWVSYNNINRSSSRKRGIRKSSLRKLRVR